MFNRKAYDIYRRIYIGTKRCKGNKRCDNCGSLEHASCFCRKSRICETIDAASKDNNISKITRAYKAVTVAAPAVDNKTITAATAINNNYKTFLDF
jgi:hypothetical protein